MSLVSEYGRIVSTPFSRDVAGLRGVSGGTPRDGVPDRRPPEADAAAGVDAAPRLRDAFGPVVVVQSALEPEYEELVYESLSESEPEPEYESEVELPVLYDPVVVLPVPVPVVPEVYADDCFRRCDNDRDAGRDALLSVDFKAGIGAVAVVPETVVPV